MSGTFSVSLPTGSRLFKAVRRQARQLPDGARSGRRHRPATPVSHQFLSFHQKT
ncbi:hypothetical protein GS8_366 [Geobacillus stearothermophilus]|uniref:Uncharacterized protein n=1 Tax=Geobacillus stearothermophilus TaxID=1422 RepID=A0ABQ7HIR9_GEOSE|nr:hypothetical protein GS8_366 [Geobacillus stearothermophilus]